MPSTTECKKAAKSPSKPLLEANAETGKFYLEAVLSRIKTLESTVKDDRRASAEFYRHLKDFLGEHGMKTLAEKMTRREWGSSSSWHWDRFVEMVKEGRS